MKKLTVALFAVLFLAVVALFVLQFTGKGNGKKESGNNVTSTAQGIVYVNIDSIVFNFDMFADRRDDLLSKQKNAEAELTNKGTQYERGVKDYQEKVSKGLVTRATATQMEQALMQQQQELVSLRDKLQGDLVEEEQVMNRQVLDYITKFLEENKTEYNYQFILGKSFGSVLLYSDKSLDITDKVLEALNKKYQSEKK
ncbi:MAG: OmpH family outer membrane protein [Bacteroidales bacterium]